MTTHQHCANHLQESVDEIDDTTANGVLQHYAYRAVRFAESYLQTSPPCEQRAGRWFHTALVFFEIMKAGMKKIRWTPDLENMRKYASEKTRMYSNLLGNLVPLTADKHAHDLFDFDETALGQGSYGVVVRATHKQSGRVYACKILYINRANTKNARELNKLHSEVAIMRELDHPHIVKLREVFYSRQRVYLIMDLCTGGNLLDYMKARPNHPEAETMARDFLRQMLYAVKYLHEHQVVHRDLKLENWLLQSEDQSTLKLIDFGLSKWFERNERMVQSVGSLYYVAPEVLENAYSEACDLWSLGVIAYMVLFGRPPFWGPNNDQLRHRIRNASYAFPADIHVSEAALDFVRRLLVRDPNMRMSAEQALQHPFLREDSSAFKHIPPASQIGTTSSSDVLTSLVEYSAFGTLRKLMLEVLAFNFTPAQIHELGPIFRAIDKKQKGTINLDDLKEYLSDREHEGDIVIPPAVVEQMKSVQTSLTQHRTSQEINYTDFVAAVMWRRIQYDEEKMQMVFEALDVHHQGFLTPQSIRQVVGLDVNQEEIESVFAEADQNNDGFIDYTEFVSLWKAHVVDQQYKPMLQSLQPSASSYAALPPSEDNKRKAEGEVEEVTTSSELQVEEEGPVKQNVQILQDADSEPWMQQAGAIPESANQQPRVTPRPKTARKLHQATTKAPPPPRRSRRLRESKRRKVEGGKDRR